MMSDLNAVDDRPSDDVYASVT